jgi:hypothetical protein
MNLGNGRGPLQARERIESAGHGTVLAVLPFIPTIPGTDTYTDQLWPK